MKQSLNNDTLAYQLGMRPALQHRDMSDCPLPQVVAQLNTVMKSSNIFSVLGDGTSVTEAISGVPEKDAIIFYMLNHAVSLIRQRLHVYEPLGSYLPILEEYHTQLAVRASRMFYYLLLICTRESRHDKQDKQGSTYKSLTTTYGAKITDFHTSLKGSSSTKAADSLKTTPPNVKLGAYTKFLADVFNHGHYSSGYGGVAWGKVAEVLRDFVHGTITAEMMMDTAFTLCHNNGPIFNKGMLFESYGSDIYKILDVQRSGQIPQLVASKSVVWASDDSVQALWTLCKSVIGTEFSGYVDWFLVEELGSVKKYPDLKTLQVSHHGYPSKFKAKKEAEDAKQELAAKEALFAMKSKVEIFPGQFIKKVKR